MLEFRDSSRDFPLATVLVRQSPLADLTSLVGETIDKNVIGHADTDVLVRGLLESVGVFAPKGVRETYKLGYGDELLVAQYNGPRLPEGTTVLPEGAGFKFMLVSVTS
jgi:hypothetical protein